MSLIVLPNQLFPNILKKLPYVTKVIIIEEPRYFTDFRFHKLKLTYHRASMKKYINDLSGHVQYIEYHEVDYSLLNDYNTYYFNPIDHKLLAKLRLELPKATMIENMGFIMTPEEIYKNKNEFYNNKRNKYNFAKWYTMQRKRFGILIENGKPTGGKWSYDTENRKKIPKNEILPDSLKNINNKYYIEAQNYINRHFPDNYGSNTDCIYPIDTATAKQHLYHFFKTKLEKFGKYEDAIYTNNHFLFHSIISPMLGIGIIIEEQVIKMAMKYYTKVPLASFEGFIRQILGWRGYCYAIYLLEPGLYKMNYYSHHDHISNNYWEKIGIPPVDKCIESMQKYGYLHHIERLMILGNWFFINRKDPKEIYRIFMEWSIDSYDWVMTPNVMGMSQNADGGMMMTRPYFSSSAYILRMSDYKRQNWTKIWDAKYYSFIADNIEKLSKNYATSRQVYHYNNKIIEDKKQIEKISREYMY